MNATARYLVTPDPVVLARIHRGLRITGIVLKHTGTAAFVFFGFIVHVVHQVEYHSRHRRGHH